MTDQAFLQKIKAWVSVNSHVSIRCVDSDDAKRKADFLRDRLTEEERRRITYKVLNVSPLD